MEHRIQGVLRLQRYVLYLVQLTRAEETEFADVVTRDNSVPRLDSALTERQ